MTVYKRKTFNLALGGVLALGMAQAAGAAMITDWSYSAISGFTSYAGEDSSGGIERRGNVEGSQTNNVGNPSELSWGYDDAYSSLTVTAESDGNLTTNQSSPMTFGTLVHNNQPIVYDASALQSFVLSTNLSLVSSAPSSEANFNVGLDPITVDGFFRETSNNNDCVSGSVSNCDDIFVLTDSDGNAVTQFSKSFVYDGYQYSVELGLDGLRGLSDDACSAAGVAAGCVGFLTQERQSNSFNRTLSIASTPVASDVPEPASIGMLGLGVFLAGFGLYRRRRYDGQRVA